MTDNKIRFLVVHLSGPIRFTGKFVFALIPFYPNKCIFLDEPPLGRLLAKPVGILCLLEAGFD